MISGRGRAWQRPLVIIGLLVSLGAGCSTTTIGGRDTPETRQWLRERDSFRANVTVRTDAFGGANVDGVLIQSPSPTEIRLSSPASGVIPLQDVERVTVVERGRGAAHGALIGAASGVLAGLALALSQGDNRSSDCGYPCRTGDRAVFWGGIFGGVGTLGGAATGALVGHRDILLLNDGK